MFLNENKESISMDVTWRKYDRSVLTDEFFDLSVNTVHNLSV